MRAGVNMRKGEKTRRGQASKVLTRVVALKTRDLKNNEKIIAIIHHVNHWSFTVINTRKRALQMYDPTNTIHVEANIKLKESAC